MKYQISYTIECESLPYVAAPPDCTITNVVVEEIKDTP